MFGRYIWEIFLERILYAIHYKPSILLLLLSWRLREHLHLTRRLSSLLNDSPSELVARQAYLPATFRVTLCKTKLLSLFIVLADEFRFKVRPWKYDHYIIACSYWYYIFIQIQYIYTGSNWPWSPSLNKIKNTSLFWKSNALNVTTKSKWICNKRRW